MVPQHNQRNHPNRSTPSDPHHSRNSCLRAAATLHLLRDQNRAGLEAGQRSCHLYAQFAARLLYPQTLGNRFTILTRSHREHSSARLKRPAGAERHDRESNLGSHHRLPSIVLH